MLKILIFIIGFALFTASSFPARAVAQRELVVSDSLDLKTVIRMRSEGSGARRGGAQINVSQIINGRVLPPVSVSTTPQQKTPITVEIITDEDSTRTFISPPPEPVAPATNVRIDRRQEPQEPLQRPPSQRSASFLDSLLAYVKALFS